MKISILLPYKENYSENYAGAVSLFVNDTTKISKYKKNITVFGSTDFKSILSKNYTNIELNKNVLFQSQSRFYVNKFIKDGCSKIFFYDALRDIDIICKGTCPQKNYIYCYASNIFLNKRQKNIWFFI
mgnify:CR=1 FL=1